MSAPVDVVKILDNVIQRSGHVVASDVVRVHDVVSDLIEADRMFDSTRDALIKAKRANRNWLPPLHPAVVAHRNATLRRTAALARIAGGKS